MGFRFRRSIGLGSGIRLNLSRSRASLSLGRKGATFNIGTRGTPRATVGLPGTGLSYTAKPWGSRRSRREVQAVPARQKTAPSTGGTFRSLIMLSVAGLSVWGMAAGRTGNLRDGAPAALTPLAKVAPAFQPVPEASAVTAALNGPRPQALHTVTVQQSANIRSEPSTSAVVVRVAYPNEILTVLNVSNGWLQISTGVATGWIAASLVR